MRTPYRTGVTAYTAQWTVTTALKKVGASLATAMSYLGVVWSMLLGFLVFGEVPSHLSLAGAALICSCSLLLGLAEHRVQSAWLKEMVSAGYTHYEHMQAALSPVKQSVQNAVETMQHAAASVAGRSPSYQRLADEQ